MATYAIGDVQGCYDQLMRLLERAGYDERRDKLWFVGDLVNRGPHSARTVRFAKSLGERQVTVLGNHDLALLVIADGIKKQVDMGRKAVMLYIKSADQRRIVPIQLKKS